MLGLAAKGEALEDVPLVGEALGKGAGVLRVARVLESLDSDGVPFFVDLLGSRLTVSEVSLGRRAERSLTNGVSFQVMLILVELVELNL